MEPQIMSKHEKFMAFLEGLKTPETEYTINTITEAYTLCNPQVLVENGLLNVLAGISMLASVAHAASAKQVKPQVDLVMNSIKQYAAHAPQGGNNQEIPQMVERLNKTISDVVDDASGQNDLIHYVSDKFEREISPIRGSSAYDTVKGTPADYPSVSDVKPSEQEAEADLKEYLKKYNINPEKVAYGEIPVKKQGFFGGEENRVFAYDPSTVSPRRAYKTEVEKQTRKRPLQNDKRF